MAVKRNDPCPCGSGKKYKKCCLKKDRAEKRTNENPLSRLEKEVESGEQDIDPGNDPELRKKAMATIGDWNDPDLLFEAWLGVYYDEQNYEKSRAMALELFEKQPAEAIDYEQSSEGVLNIHSSLDGYNEQQYVEDLLYIESNYPAIYEASQVYYALDLFEHFYLNEEREKAAHYIKQVALLVNEEADMFFDLVDYLRASGDKEFVLMAIMTVLNHDGQDFEWLDELMIIYQHTKRGDIYHASDRGQAIDAVLKELDPYRGFLPKVLFERSSFEKGVELLEQEHDLKLETGKQSKESLIRYHQKVGNAFCQYLYEMEACPNLLAELCAIRVVKYFNKLLDFPKLRRKTTFQISADALDQIAPKTGIMILFMIKWEQLAVLNTGLYHFANFLEKKGVWNTSQRDSAQREIERFHKKVRKFESAKYKPFEKIPFF